jgi:hypothetical protein
MTRRSPSARGQDPPVVPTCGHADQGWVVGTFSSDIEVVHQGGRDLVREGRASTLPPWTGSGLC